MSRILLHPEILNDIERCYKKKWYRSLSKEMPKVCRLLKEDGKMPGEAPVLHVNLSSLEHKTFHARISLPEENIGKRQGGRIIYVKENSESIKIIYVGGHKDKRYDNGPLQVQLIEKRYSSGNFMEHTEEFDFDNTK